MSEGDVHPESSPSLPKPREAPRAERTAEQQIRRMSRRSFLWAGAVVIGTYEAFHWLNQQPESDGLGKPFRQALEFNEGVASSLYSPNRLSPTFTDADITEPRVNDIGMSDDFDPQGWELKVQGTSGKPLVLTLDDVKALPKHDFVTELKCIEGWSFFAHWAGARFADFYLRYPGDAGTKFVALQTPDDDYYVSIELPSMLHPQTMLCYEMNGGPLTLEHGAPLRLVIPHKYGIKNIKRIGLIAYSTVKEKDYWGERGYDWYAGL